MHAECSSSFGDGTADWPQAEYAHRLSVEPTCNGVFFLVPDTVIEVYDVVRNISVEADNHTHDQFGHGNGVGPGDIAYANAGFGSSIFIDGIGAGDDLTKGRSTFMVEMTETANILHNATENSLVLMDEIGRGTSTYDGLSLAQACALHLAQVNQSYSLFATHYFEITAFDKEIDNIDNVHLDAVEHDDTIVFLHSVKPGAASRSYGLQVAALAGIPSRVLENAKITLAQLESSSQPDPDIQVQTSFFNHIPEPTELEKEMKLINPDDLTPRQALDWLYKLMKLG